MAYLSRDEIREDALKRRELSCDARDAANALAMAVTKWLTQDNLARRRKTAVPRAEEARQMMVQCLEDYYRTE